MSAATSTPEVDLATCLRILARLDLLQAARIVRLTIREPAVALLAALVLVGGFIMASRLAPAALVRPGAALLLGTLFWGSVLVVTWAALQGRYATRLRAGPFQPLVASRLALATWLAVRSAALVLGLAAVTAAPALLVSVQFSLGLMISALAGTIPAAAVRAAAFRTWTLQKPTRAPRPRAAQFQARPHRPEVLMISLSFRRRIGGAPAFAWIAGLLLLGAAAGNLATTNSGPVAGVWAFALFGAPAALLASELDLALVAVLGREPIGLGRLLLTCAAPAVAFGLAVLAGAAVAGLSPGAAASVAGGLTALAAARCGFTALHGVRLSPPAAQTANGVDLAISAGLPLLTPWALIWPLVRIPLLWRQAARARWWDE